jgi:hypothetical protein
MFSCFTHLSCGKKLSITALNFRAGALSALVSLSSIVGTSLFGALFSVGLDKYHSPHFPFFFSLGLTVLALFVAVYARAEFDVPVKGAEALQQDVQGLPRGIDRDQHAGNEIDKRFLLINVNELDSS